MGNKNLTRKKNFLFTAFETQVDFIEIKNDLSSICDFIPGTTPVA